MAGEKVNPVVFNCPECGTVLEISALGYTTTVVCKSCKSILNANHPLYKKIGQFNEATYKYKPFFEVGTFGILKSVKWKIIGFVVRFDKKADFSWEEYLLYNPYKGFRWLLRIDKHFSLTSRLAVQPVYGEKNQISIEDKQYALFNEGNVAVDYVVGEFYWRVVAGETVKMKDYISPPYMVSEEVSLGTEVNWSISEYLTNKEVVKAFNPEAFSSSYEPYSVAANQPNPYDDKKNIFKYTSLAILGLCLVGVTSSFSNTSKIVKSDKIIKEQQVDSIAAAVPFVSTSFDIPGSIGNLEINMSSPVNNQWVEAGITFVNESTGEDYSFSHGVEFYSGRDSDGLWSEGSQVDSKIISSVPGGLYHMEVELAGDMPTPTANMTVTRNAVMTSNFIVALILLLLPALWVFWRSRSFEVSRWSQSDYNPYPASSDYSGDDE